MLTTETRSTSSLDQMPFTSSPSARNGSSDVRGAAPALECRGLAKQFGGVQAVEHLDLTVALGQILALVGPSGCGKTTALRLIAGFDHPDGGTVSLAGRVVGQPGTGLPPEKRRVGMVFQEGALFPHLTVEQNIAYGLPRAARRNGRVKAMFCSTGIMRLSKKGRTSTFYLQRYQPF